MKRAVLLAWTGACLLTVPVSAQHHIIIAWNDLGMHCSNKDFSTLAVLPPFNTVVAQVIQVGDSLNPPVVLTNNLRVTYEIPGNTSSVGKTNFWDYEDHLFGVQLPANVGLTGNGLSGNLQQVANYFVVTGIPITPFTDADLTHEDPFQLGWFSVYSEPAQWLAATHTVVPVSNEINCLSAGCHASEQAILDQHAAEAMFNPADKPILCAGCHSSNALGTPGLPGLPSLSEAIHKHHGEITNDCYKCHPGPNTQCLRDVMATEHGFVCQTCHGSVTQVGASIDAGRKPWLEEPSCGNAACHGPVFAEEPGSLYRNSRGHGGLFCSACHGSPHAIVPSRENRDNVQNVALQGHPGTLHECEVCHGVIPTGAGPHGVSACPVRVDGDLDVSGQVSSSDIIYLVNYVFKGGLEPQPCAANANVNCDAAVASSDVIYLVNYVFKGGVSPCDVCSDSPLSCP